MNTNQKDDLMYAMWRFDMWLQGGHGTYRDIDRAVETGDLIPGPADVQNQQQRVAACGDTPMIDQQRCGECARWMEVDTTYILNEEGPWGECLGQPDHYLKADHQCNIPNGFRPRKEMADE